MGLHKRKEIGALLADAGFAFDEYDGNTLEEPGERPGRLLYVCTVRR